MRVVDVDVAFVVYLVVDWLWLWATGSLAGTRAPAWRLSLVAAAAAAAGVWALFPSGRWLTHPAGAVAGSLAIVAAAFLGRVRPRSLPRLLLFFFATGALMAGAALLVGGVGHRALVLAPAGPGAWTVWAGPARGPEPLQLLGVGLAALGAGVLWRAVVAWQQLQRGQGVVELHIRAGAGQVRLRGLVDSGNGLVEPLSGLPVVVVEAAAVADLPPDHLARRFRPLPYRAVGGGGWLPAFRPDALVVGGLPVDGVVALATNRLDSAGRFQALVPPALAPLPPGRSGSRHGAAEGTMLTPAQGGESGRESGCRASRGACG